MWQRNSAVGRGLHFGLGPQHENSTSLCCCLQGVRAQNCFTPLSAWQLPYIKCAPPKFHPLGNVWNVNSHCKPSPSISAPWGVLPKTNLAAYSFSCKTRALSYSVHNKINHLSFLEATRKYFYANTPYKVWNSWSHLKGLPVSQFKLFLRQHLVAFMKRTWIPKQPPPEAVGSQSGNKCIHNTST